MAKNQQLRDILERLTLETMTEEQASVLGGLIQIDPINHLQFCAHIARYQSILNAGQNFIDAQEVNGSFLMQLGDGSEEEKRLNNTFFLQTLAKQKYLLFALDQLPYGILQGIANDINTLDHLKNHLTQIDPSKWDDVMIAEARRQAATLLKPENAQRQLVKMTQDCQSITLALENATLEQVKHVKEVLIQTKRRQDFLKKLTTEQTELEKAQALIDAAEKELKNAQKKLQPKQHGNFFVTEQDSSLLLKEEVVLIKEGIKNLPKGDITATVKGEASYKSVYVTSTQCVRTTLFSYTDKSKPTFVLRQQANTMTCNWVGDRTLKFNEEDSTRAALVLAKKLLSQCTPFKNHITIEGQMPFFATQVHAALLLLRSADSKFSRVRIDCLVERSEQPQEPAALLKFLHLAPDMEKQFIKSYLKTDRSIVSQMKQELMGLTSQQVEEDKSVSFCKN